jgi:uncharacterized membrane protein YfcA
MTSLPIAAMLAVTILSTSFISGIFGMAGGMILMGILLALMPVAAAMVLHGVTQMASNGWRAWLWREHIAWRVAANYAQGAIIAVGIFAVAQVSLGKAVTLVMLGSVALAGLVVPAWLAPNIWRRADAIGCGVLCTSLQFLSGVSGPIFDVFFARSNVGRKQIVATKAAIQVLGHLLKVAYFGQMLAGADTGVAPVAILLAIPLAMAGTQLSRQVLEVISDAQFRRWTRGLIAILAAIYLIQGLILLLPQQS